MTSAGQEEPVTMRSSLTQTEIRNVLADTEKYHFWAMPQAGASSQEATTVDGKTVVQACADGGSIRIEGFEGSINHEVIREDCGPRAGHEDALSFAGSLVRVAMAHFPNLPSHYFLEN